MKRRIIQEPDGEPVATVFLRVFGVPIWIESGSEAQFLRNCARSRRLTRHAEKAIKQLERIRQLLDEIDSRSPNRQRPAISREEQTWKNSPI